LVTDAKLPYVTASGNITKALEKIQPAATPDRFTQDYLSTKLALSGGGARPLIPFLKRTGFLASDGTPTDRYRRFRAAGSRGAAAAAGLREGYAALYQRNEYAHYLTDQKLKDLIIEETGAESGSSTVQAIFSSFRALQAFAKFDHQEEIDEHVDDETNGGDDESENGLPGGLRLGYTINLHLPATSDIAVFNAIFKSLRENLLH
jgi:hypothetical protein